MTLTITKRDGSRVPFDADKINKHGHNNEKKEPARHVSQGDAGGEKQKKAEEE